MFPGRNAAVQDSEEVTSNVLDNGPVIDAVPISFAYIPEGSPSRGRCDICGRGGGRCEDQGTNTSSENDDTDDDDDATDATGEHHK
ncbi:unnamed protein product [Microthlaspi erraticum]|uniref:Uncharacterized protein n=1 Tax=Microthlaspi erraticum TaxID=1685480 RepID=A0A6D2IEA7_9BRAS|nr:unnamed protein product [Microthlaspi erraticum]